MNRKTNSRGLYRSELEHDSCGIGLIADISGKASRSMVSDALTMLENMEHRGATGSDPETGDGAGIMTQIPYEYLRKQVDFQLPENGRFGVGMVFYSSNPAIYKACKELFETHAKELDFKILGYRKVPVDHNVPGIEARKVEPFIEQVFIVHKDSGLSAIELERKLFILRNYTTHKIGHTVSGNNGEFYFSSLSATKINYKGQLKTEQLLKYYPDLQHEDFISSYALVHSRFSTNTFPNWKLAQPFKYLAHNGEINTIRGNLNKMKSKESLFHSEYFTEEEMEKLLPVTDMNHSDSANLDALVEMLVLSGRSLPHVLMMLVPEAWQDNKQMGTEKKAFYKYHTALMEPWDGPAAITFCDNNLVGATLDRNGLRPARYCITKDNRFVLASETGALRLKPEEIVEEGRLKPGKMICVDLSQKKVLYDDEIKKAVYGQKPYQEWIKKYRTKLRLLDIPEQDQKRPNPKMLIKKQIAYGFSEEDISKVLLPMAEDSKEAIGSMGADAPLAVLSSQSQHISNYFKQYFAQVSNPPIDPIRERAVMSLFTKVGESLNILKETPEHTKQVHISQPVLSEGGFGKIQNLERLGYFCQTISCLFNGDGQEGRLVQALDTICEKAEKAIENGKNILILSNRSVDSKSAPVPSLLAVGTVHHHLIKKRLRTKVGLILDSGDIWEVHHFATAVGYGASAVHPFMAIESINQLFDQGKIRSNSADDAFENYSLAVGKGLLKVMSKMGISTLQSYQAAQIFECIGLSQEVINRSFTGTISRLDGLSFDDLAKECLTLHHLAFKTKTESEMPVGGYFQWKRTGEKHLINPETVHLLQKSIKLKDYSLFKEYSDLINEQQEEKITLRSLLKFKKNNPISIDEVEPAENILKRFCTGAMSFGSLSHEAHSTLAVAMNRIGAKSNSGEGGEDEMRFEVKPNGDWERSAIKQVASGRFGVTSNYLTNANEIQIKIAQGAKPGEGGQLPGHKVDDWIAKVRYATPGVGLISPPPHHDIYSIEDLKQLIYDLKNANEEARINVKLVSEAGVGTIAAGVSKAKADVIMISGYDGGTGASPLSSIRHTGLPWELGLSEAQQTLVKNNLRNRVVLQVDGKLLTGRDIVIATLLGAEEWGVSTAALIAEGCIMMRKCHLNTCPVGVATQNPDLRKLFTGDPNHVITLFEFLVEEIRELMAELGFRTINDMVGQSQVLKTENHQHWKLQQLDLSPILFKEQTPPNIGVFNQIEQDFEIEQVLDRNLIERCLEAIEKKSSLEIETVINNTDRACGAMLSHEISKRYGSSGLVNNTIKIKFTGYAGQSFGAFLALGITFELEGKANDYIGKGLSGGHIIVYPGEKSEYKTELNSVIGNVALYGATSGKAYFRGVAGERFCVRNSGATSVVEGVGDHGCEYMTGGRVIVLGETGQNFAAGMSGGIAFVYDEAQKMNIKCNKEMINLERLSQEDETFIKEEISAFHKYTGSKVAEEILKNWNNVKSSFIKVMPEDYKRVLESKKKQSEMIDNLKMAV
ncbi:MAG: glutamate synthase large subunit [Bacteroidota bacterium]